MKWLSLFAAASCLAQNDPLFSFNNGNNRVECECGGFWASTYCWHLKSTGQQATIYDSSGNELTEYQESGGFGSAHIADAWPMQSHASNIVIALIDDGYDVTHPDLAGRFLPGKVFGTGKSKLQWRDELPVGGHGTMTAGTIGAVGNNGIGIAGVCRDGVQLLPLVATDPSAIVESINYAVTTGAQIINLPWGTSEPREDLYAAVSNANATGVLLVCAAENARVNYDDTNWTCYTNVGIINVSNEWLRATNVECVPPAADYPMQWGRLFTNLLCVSGMSMKDKPYGWAYSTNYVHLLAPCRRIPTTVPSGYAYWSGNSAACAIVSGAAALLKQRFPNEWPKNRILAGVDVRQQYAAECSTSGSLNLERSMALRRITLTILQSADRQSWVAVTNDVYANEPRQFFKVRIE